MICNPSFKVLLVIFNAYVELEQCLFELWPSSVACCPSAEAANWSREEEDRTQTLSTVPSELWGLARAAGNLLPTGGASLFKRGLWGMCLLPRGYVVFGEGWGVFPSLLERKEGWQHLQEYWVVGCVVLMSLLSLGITNGVLLAFSSLPSILAGTGSFFLAGPVGFLPSHMQERRGSEGWLVWRN